MFCQECGYREKCDTPCAALERHLASVCGSQRELALPLELLDIIGQAQETSPQNPLSDYGIRFELLRLEIFIHRLPEMEQRVVVGRFYDGKTYRELETEMRLSRGSLQHHYRAALKRLKRSLVVKIKEKRLSFSFLILGYNKRSEYGAKKIKTVKENSGQAGGSQETGPARKKRCRNKTRRVKKNAGQNRNAVNG
jgi:hypothetical protein